MHGTKPKRLPGHQLRFAWLRLDGGATGAHRRLMHQLDLLDEEALAKVGPLPWSDPMTLMDFFYSMAEHYADHVADLKAYQERCLGGCD